MSQVIESPETDQSALIPECHLLQVQEGQEIVWLACGRHNPTGKRIVLTITANDGDEAFRLAQNEARHLDPFGELSDWDFSIEAYEVDLTIATQCDDTQEFTSFEPIPYHLTEKYAAKRVDPIEDSQQDEDNSIYNREIGRQLARV